MKPNSAALENGNPHVPTSIADVASSLRLSPVEAVALTARRLGLSRLHLGEARLLSVDLAALSFQEAHRRRAVLARRGSDAQLILVNPFSSDWPVLRRRFAGARVWLMEETDFLLWMTEIEAGQTALASLESNEAPRPGHSDSEVIALESLHQDSAPAIKVVNSTLYDALKSGASDIHLESESVGLSIKFRLDGVIVPAGRVGERALAEQIISRIKVMAELDIAERRIPQDGRLQVIRQGRTVDVRVSIMPSIHGEDAVLRLLDRQALASHMSGLSLQGLGFDGQTTSQIIALAKRPYGMLLVTGPTGSGKTTTLYAALSDTHDPRQKTITIEDPVEYQLPGVLQIPVNERKGLDFARGLRSILRHDPDRILVGEIRDAETARIAVQSALTGHMVFTTVHANGVLDVYGRFAQFGIDSYSLASSLSGILAQRLIRKRCIDCNGSGCTACRNTGFRGRFAIGELLVVDSAMRNLIAERAAPSKFEEAARAAGLISLRSRAMCAIDEGLTTLDEVDRVTAH